MLTARSLRAFAVTALTALAVHTASGQAPSAPRDSLTDGPYVTWLSPTAAVVRAVCQGAPRLDTVRAARATLRFTNPCAPNESFALSVAEPKPTVAVVPKASRIMAISDVEGDYEAMVGLLQKHGVLDANAKWAWGKGRLVLVGDMVDRGTNVTEVLWLIHRLEGEAQAAGGGVHYVLGNHDVMLLTGDHRYVARKYREVSERLNTSLIDLFGPTTELGRWMRSKPVMVRIDTVLFTHGGLSPAFADRKLDLATVNGAARAGLLASRDGTSESLARAVLGQDGPLWFRGYFSAGFDSTALPPALARYGATLVVVGHTIVPTITRLQAGCVIGIDVTFKTAEKAQGLLIEQGKLYRVSASGEREQL